MSKLYNAVHYRQNKWDVYPSSVRQMLIKRSAPQPAIKKTPTGGTIAKDKS